MDIEERQMRRMQRIERMRREKRRAELLHKLALAAMAAAAVLIGVGIGYAILFRGGGSAAGEAGGETAESAGAEAPGTEPAGMEFEGTEIADTEDGGPDGEFFGPWLQGGGAEDILSADGTAIGAVSEEENILPESGTVPLSQSSGTLLQITEIYDREAVIGFDDTIISEYGILIDLEEESVLAQKAAWDRMNPASMTKILTVLVAAERLTEADMDETVPITIDITDYCYVNGCSVTGYERDELATVRDLFYGTVLPSGADSALALAVYVAGSHEAFVELMNDKLAELGLAETSHFTNCVGLYDENHYTTAYDMAVMLKAAVDNEFCRNVLSAHTYNTAPTEQHPEGLLISNWFLRRIEDRDTHGEVLCAKTGYVDQSGSCAASYSIGDDGKEYLCVTAGSSTSLRCIADQVELYQRFLPEPDDGEENI